ncbi:MAG: cytochrome c [Vicinamibacterales bacterium]
MTRSVLAVAATGVLLVGSVRIGLAQGPTTADGVYTSDQAAKGKALFAEVCLTCHQPAKFTGAEFTRAYVGKPLSEISATMAEMPQDNPGSLTAAEFATLIAYFLEMNEYPAGAAPLDGETSALRRIMVSPRP